MESIRLIISLPQDDTYQKAQAKAAKQAGAELGVEIQILQADNDAVLQSQQLLELIQSRPERRPHAILSEPLTSTALARVAEAAVAAGIAWVPLNCDVDYLQTLRQRAKV